MPEAITSNAEVAALVQRAIAATGEIGKAQKIMNDALVAERERIGGVIESATATQEKIVQLLDRVTNVESGLKDLKDRKVRVGLVTSGEEDLSERKAQFFNWVAATLRRDREAIENIEKTLTTTGSGTGLEWVPPDFHPVVIRLLEDASIVRPKATVIPLTSDTADFPSIASVTVAWTAQGTATTSQDPTTSQVSLVTKTMRATVDLSNELLQDAQPNLAQTLAELFAEAAGQEEDKQALVGNSGGTDPFDGVLYATGVNNVAMSTDTFADVTADYLADMIAAVKSGQLAGANFIFHRTIFNIIRKLKDTNGAYIYAGPGEGQPATVWGFPFLLSDQMPALADDAASTPFVAFGNLKNVYIGDRMRPEIKLSEEALFKNNITVLRFVQREAIKIAVAAAFSKLTTSA